MYYEKIELYGDIFKSLNYVISDTHMGDEFRETKIILTNEDNMNHFNWCWNKVVGDFQKENIIIGEEGDHKDYFISFFNDTLNQTGTSFVNLEYTDIKTHVVGESIVIFDKSSPVKPLIYLLISNIQSITKSGTIFNIDASSSE
jgi:hypothetical protein